MSDPAGIGGLFQAGGQIASSYIQSQAQQQMQQQQAQDQANLEMAAFNDQMQYINTEEGALRNAITGVSKEFGNPFMKAQGFMAGPEKAGGGTFGPTGATPQPGVPKLAQAPQGAPDASLVQGLLGNEPSTGSAPKPPPKKKAA